MKSYKGTKINDKVYERVFDCKDRDFFVWHRDKEDRRITVTSEAHGWKFQMDNCLPVDLVLGVVISIPKNTFHRIIAGTGIIKIRLEKE